MARWPAWLGSLESQQYRRYWFGNFVSVAGQWMQRFGQDWLVWTLTESPRALGVTTAAQFTPVLLGSLWGGTFSDRSDLRRLLLVTQAVSACLALALAVLTWAGVVELWMVWVFAALLGIVTVFDNPSRHSLIMTLVGPTLLPNAVSLNSVGHNLGRVVGPSVGGAVVGLAGVGTAFALNALSFVPMLVAVYLLSPVPRQAHATEASSGHQLVDGLRHVWSLVDVRTSLLLLLVVSVFAQNYRVLLTVLATDSLGGGASLYGLFLGLIGLGALGGGLLTIFAERPTLRTIVTAAAVFGALSLVVPLTGSIVVVGAALVLVGVANSVVNISTRSLELLGVDSQYRGRVMALHQMMFVGSAPVGGLLLGQVAESFGVTWGFVVAGGSILVVVAVAGATRFGSSLG